MRVQLAQQERQAQPWLQLRGSSCSWNLVADQVFAVLVAAAEGHPLERSIE